MGINAGANAYVELHHTSFRLIQESEILRGRKIGQVCIVT